MRAKLLQHGRSICARRLLQASGTSTRVIGMQGKLIAAG